MEREDLGTRQMYYPERGRVSLPYGSKLMPIFPRPFFFFYTSTALSWSATDKKYVITLSRTAVFSHCEMVG
jgi:hypothetical protein